MRTALFERYGWRAVSFPGASLVNDRFAVSLAECLRADMEVVIFPYSGGLIVSSWQKQAANA